MARLVQQLPPGPLAIIGDIHGEIDALNALLGRVGVRGTRSERGLVFVGDLVDRGPDSPAVVRRVRELVDAGVAWVVAGNHELNLLADETKEGNGWFLGHEDRIHHEDGSHGACFDSAPVRAEERKDILGFFDSFPLLLQRPDLRVVHACDHAASRALLPEHAPIAALSREHRDRINARLDARGERNREHRGMAHQNENPVKVLTSGLEHPLPPGVTFFAGGKHRTVTRTRWWLDAGATVPTVVGHYWRRRAGHVDPAKMDVWDDQPAFAWSENVFCVDYSVGRRFAERAEGGPPNSHGGLAGLLWPERTLVWDDSEERTPTTGLELVAPHG